MTISSVDRVYELLRSQYPDEPPLYVGDTVYYTLLEYPREPRFVVEACITSVEFVVGHPMYTKEHTSLWLHIGPDYPGGYQLVGPKIPIEKDAHGWPKWDRPDPALVLDPDVQLGSWFVCLDLPVGHAVSPYEDVTPNLSEALQAATPFRGRSRHAKSVLHTYIKRRKEFIASTRRKSVAQMGFPNYRRWPDRKIYWRRK